MEDAVVGKAVMDHLVFAAPDLETGVRHVQALVGVEMSPGGQHHGFGTKNRLLGLGGRAYMEVVSPDPEQPDPEGPRWFGLDTLEAPRLVSWCAAPAGASPPDLEELVERGRGAGIDLGEPRMGRRVRGDGSVLSWTMTDPWADRAGGVIPFFIDWGDTSHPAASLSSPCGFVGLRVEHPEPGKVQRWLRTLGLDTPVSAGDAPALIATLSSPNGMVELR